jgi:hypothetical protein
MCRSLPVPYEEFLCTQILVNISCFSRLYAFGTMISVSDLTTTLRLEELKRRI